jgi:hypothetical protein
VHGQGEKMAHPIEEGRIPTIAVGVIDEGVEFCPTVVAAVDGNFNSRLTIRHSDGCKKRKRVPCKQFFTNPGKGQARGNRT